MIEALYAPFRKWSETGTIWIYSDTHFADDEMKYLRKNYIGDDEQIARINAKVGRKDTLIVLGDVGDIEYARKMRGYKVLIMGNHDVGRTKYERQVVKRKFDKATHTKGAAIAEMKSEYPGWFMTVDEGYDVSHAPFQYWEISVDNGLFDEVYEGPLFITEKLFLSHEPISLPFALNIHGHDHSNWNSDAPNHLNVCAEHINYTPVNLTRLMKNGLLSKVESIHRVTIDGATNRKKQREARHGTV